MLAVFLPADDDEEALLANKSWRGIFAVQPVLLIASIVLFLVLVRTDTPRFYISKGENEKAKLAISKIYNTNGDSVKLNNIFEAEKKACAAGAEDTSEVGQTVTMKQALWSDERYTRSSWIAILIMAFQCLTGYYAIIAYSAVLLEDDFSDTSGRSLTARQGVYLIQGFNLLGSVASIYCISKLGRRTIFLFGQGGIAVSLVGIAIVTGVDAPATLLTFICLVSFLFQLTLGPLAPLYAAEVCTDIALGAVMITEDVVVLLQDFVTPTLLNTGLGPVGVFLIFGVFSVLGFAFIFLFVPETDGLSEQEKREIFMPGAKYGRRLKEGEECNLVGIEHKSEMTIQQEIFKSFVGMLSRSSSYDGLATFSQHASIGPDRRATIEKMLVTSESKFGGDADIVVEMEEHEESSAKSARTHTVGSCEDLEHHRSGHKPKLL